MSDAYQTETREAHGRKWRVEWRDDDHCGAPWEECDGHGPVSDWTSRDKRPGEMILNSDGHQRRYYDFQAAVAEAKKDGWNTRPYNWPSKGARAAAAAMADFRYLKGWCNDDWHYCGLTVTLLNEDGEDTDTEASLWGIESNSYEYFEEVIAELMGQCIVSLAKATYPVSEVGV